MSVQASGTGAAQALASAAAAMGQADWGAAREYYAQALAEEESADALEGLALACWFEDDIVPAIEARERAYAIRRESGDALAAARVAAFLAWDYGAGRGMTAVANGWLQRARRLTEEIDPLPEFAWLPLIEASFHLDTDADAVLRLSTEALEYARAHGAFEAEMTARTLQGLALVTLGRVDEGTPLLDEGAAAATAGEMRDPLAIGSCCCNMIIACERSRDFDRAGQWCGRLEAYAQRTGQRPLLALCRAHHGVVLTMRGEWERAEEELAWATSELSTLRPALAGYARVQFAELRRRQGRPRDARELLGQAAGHVAVPLVQAQLALDDGDAAAALDHVERYLRGLDGERPIETAGAFELLVPVHLRLGATDAARRAQAELAAIAASVRTDALRAAERYTAGLIALAERDPASAQPSLEDAVALYEQCVQPFEAAHARLALARALDARDRRSLAVETATEAVTAFDTLGAVQAAGEARNLLTRLGGRAPGPNGGLTTRELEVLALVADGLSNKDIARQLVVSEHTVHRHLANVYTKLGVASRAAAVARALELGLLV